MTTLAGAGSKGDTVVSGGRFGKVIGTMIFYGYSEKAASY
jgi:hypothetical protein